MVKVLIVAHEAVGTLMTGPAIRCWELANSLARFFAVTLAVPETPDLSASSFSLVTYPYDSSDTLEDLALEADAIVISGYPLGRCPALSRSHRPLIVDVYNPFPIENMSLHRGRSLDELTAIIEGDFRALSQLLQAGDFFLCGSERQRDFWLGLLAASGRLNPWTCEADPSFRGLIDVVSMGIPEEPPSTPGPVKGVFPGIEPEDFLLVWPGGLWEWLDPLTAVEAVNLLADAAPDVKLLFPGFRHPHPDRIVSMKTPDMALERAKALGILGSRVFFCDWTPYEQRGRYLLDADVGLSLHFDSLESHLANRVRLLDCLWAGTRVISTRGDVIAEAMAARGLARIVPPRDPASVAAAILSCRSEGDSRTKLANGFRQMAAEYQWSAVSRPLVDFLRQPRRAADRLGDLPSWEIERPASLKRALAEAVESLHQKDAELAAAHDLLRRIEQGKVMRLMNALQSARKKLIG